MRLIVLASSESNIDGAPDGTLINTFNADILIKKNSQIALKSITAEYKSASFVNTEFQDYILELITFDIDSYYGYINDSAGLVNGQRRTILEMIPADSVSTKVVGATTQIILRWTPSYPTFLNIANKKDLNLRNLGVRLTKYDGSSVELDGAMFVSLLIKDSDDC